MKPHDAILMQTGTLSFVVGVDLYTTFRQITPLSHAHITHSHIYSYGNGIGFTVMKTVTVYFAMSHMCYCHWQCM